MRIIANFICSLVLLPHRFSVINSSLILRVHLLLNRLIASVINVAYVCQLTIHSCAIRMKWCTRQTIHTDNYKKYLSKSLETRSILAFFCNLITHPKNPALKDLPLSIIFTAYQHRFSQFYSSDRSTENSMSSSKKYAQRLLQAFDQAIMILLLLIIVLAPNLVSSFTAIQKLYIIRRI